MPGKTSPPDFNLKSENFSQRVFLSVEFYCKIRRSDQQRLLEDLPMTSARRAGATTVATLCGLALTVVAAEAFAHRWVQRAGLDVWNLSSAISANKTADQEYASLKAKEQKLYREIQLSNIVAEELAAGTITLKDAVDEMEPVLRNRTGFVETLQVSFGASSLREGVARYLISRIPRSMTHDLLELSNTLYRLEGEFEMLNKG
jgi:hypothetical protein